MSNQRHLGTLLCLLASACTTLSPAPRPPGAPQPHSVSLDGIADRAQAGWARTASEGLSLRSGRAIGLATLRALDGMCRDGRHVEVLAAPSVAKAALRQTHCLSVWQTTHPDVLRSPHVLLVDGRFLVVEGQLRHAAPGPALQEATARAHIQRAALSERLR